VTAVTFTPAADRDARLATRARWRLERHDVLAVATAAVAALAIGLAWAGQLAAARTSGAHAAINLNAAPSAAELEARMASVFTHGPDRRFAARELAQHLLGARDRGEPLSHVGALASLTVGSVRLLSSGELAALKPFVVVRSEERFSRSLLTYAAVYLAAFLAVAGIWRFGRVGGDPILLAAAHLLTAVGFALLVSRQDPLRDTLLFPRFVTGVLLGLGLMAGASRLDLRRLAARNLSFVPLAAALGLSALLVVFGSGPGGSSAKVNLGPVQPIEAIRLLLAFFLAGYFARRWELLRRDQQPTARLTWLRIPPLTYVAPVIGGVGAALLFFFVQKDLGPALFLCCVFLAMYAVARGRVTLALAGIALLVAGFYAGHRLGISETLLARVSMWQSPWDNAVSGGDQLAQSIWALSTGGLFGTGLGLGDTQYLPAGHTDLVLAAAGEDLGFIGLGAIGLLYALIGWRGFRTAARASSDYGFFLAMAVTLFLIVPVLVMAAGALGVTPLTGVVTPFLSYGGSAMAANFAALGILAAVRRAGATTTPAASQLRAPIRQLGRALAITGVALTLVLADVQLLRADRYVARPHLGTQADQVRRFQYNRRLLDVAELVPRGAIFDRRGILLAGNQSHALEARAAHDRLDLATDASCIEPIERCYPLGTAAFHVLGDRRSRINWSASNSSYVERDSDATLRGFDDRARTVQTTGVSGTPATAVRRDYDALVPLLRHRHDLDHPAVQPLLRAQRDLRLTLDAGLQLQLDRILATAARRSKSGKAAAAVLDSTTGDILAIASYPRPAMDGGLAGTDALLDRARYGLYPPGSTFKLVTAAAALRRSLDMSGELFGCVRLPDGRVGARLPGGGRPIRDDVTDTHPHGVIDMHGGLVQSCNAYFAQLARHVGPEAILQTALDLGISVSPGQSLNRLRATLPQAGYGQGDVIASPLRMARVAAAIAAGGELREPRLDAGQPASAVEHLLPRAAAARLGGFMRDAVAHGTGRALRAHPGRIAGKTGTAEVTGAASHSWFVGFAPSGQAASRIAFAVIVENAGYGGDAAAAAAGAIVSAAMTSGVIR
jgi:cell division protein FtsW (lipid II flippase)